MPLRVCSLAVLVVLSLTAAAQPYLGDPFPLTATRYGSARGTDPRLLSNGREPVVFWSSGQHVLMSRLVNGRFTIGRTVGEGGLYDVVWTGSSFLVVSQAPGFGGPISAQLFDANGEPRGDAFRIAEHGGLPRIAFNGRNVLMVYQAPAVPTIDYGLHALLLDAEGRPLEEPRPLGITTQARVALASNGESFAALVPNVFEPSLLFFDADGRLQSRTVFHSHGAGVAIATDGRRYLGVAACAEGWLCMPAVARVVEADGTAGAPVELDQPFHMNPTAVWSGTNWLVAYTRDLHLQEAATLQVVQLDAAARVVERRESRSAIESSLGVVGDRVLAAWTSGRFQDRIHVGPVPFDDATSQVASFTANAQALSGVASSPRGTLVVWNETGNARTTVHVGFRAADGAWSEREIYSLEPRDCFYCYEEPVNVQVAGNGDGFLLHLQSATGHFLRRLDATGNPIGGPFAPPFFPQRILSDGRDYLVIHVNSQSQYQVARMTPEGTIVSDRALPPPVLQPRDYATNGNGGLITVRIDTTYINHYPHVLGLGVVRLDRDLNPIDTTPIRLAPDDQQLSTPRVGWDGRQWVVTWIGRDGIMAAQIAESGPANPKVVKLADGRASEFVIQAVPGAAAILMNEAWNVNRLVFLRHDGSVTAPLVVSTLASDRGWESGDLALLPDGSLGYLESPSRVTFRVISDVPLPEKPAAPRLFVARDLLTWEPPPQPVDGFRIEARIDDGPWVEVVPPLDRDARSVRVALVPGSRYVFRVGGFNEAGMGEWSTPIRRRRAVR